MFNKKIFLIFSVIFLFSIMFVSAIKPITSVTTSDDGLFVEATAKDYIRTGEDHEFEIHVFNKTDGGYITTDTTCYMHLYHKRGNHEYEGFDNTVSHYFDYAFDLNGTNFTSRGEYQAKFQCNHSSGVSGGEEIFFWVNDYGEELTPARATSFNFSMLMLMILFILSLIGLFRIEVPAGKLALYWVCHIFFIVGSFSLWQFMGGYATAYVGLAGVWKVLFWVSTVAVLPMIILSGAWIFYIHAVNEHTEKLMEKGVDVETAFKMAKKKRGSIF